jgi:hypothetical protein
MGKPCDGDRKSKIVDALKSEGVTVESAFLPTKPAAPSVKSRARRLIKLLK